MSYDLTYAGPVAAIDTENYRTLRIQCRAGAGDPSSAVVEVKRAWSPRFDSPAVSFASPQTLNLDGTAITEIDVTDIGWVHIVVTTVESGASFDFEYALDGPMNGRTYQIPINMDAPGLRGFVAGGYKAIAVGSAREAVTTGVLELKQAMGASYNAVSFSPAATVTLDGTTVTDVSASPGGVIHAACTTAQSGLGADLFIYVRDEVVSDSASGGSGGIASGSSFPGSPSDGDAFIRTDLDMPEMFVYDGTRGKWLGELRLWQFARATAASSGSMNLQIASVQTNTARGVLTPAALTVVGIEAFNANSGVTCDFNLYEGSTNLTTLMSFSSDRAKHDHTLNYDLDADSGWPHKYIQVNNITAGTLNNPIVNVYFRRRET